MGEMASLDPLPGYSDPALARCRAITPADRNREAARAAAAGPTIAVRRTGLDVVVKVEYDGAIDSEVRPLADVSDRLAAAGGQLRRDDAHCRPRLIASLSCG